jgi:twitching motility two-component system response regulator PilH
MPTVNKILVVDDSDIERLHVVKILKEAGFTVVEAVSGEDGVQKAVEHKPDLVLMDVMMPGVNGFQATRHLSRTEETKNIPVFMLTSRGEDTDKAWAIKQGAAKHFTKPADRVQLLAEIQKLQAK